MKKLKKFTKQSEFTPERVGQGSVACKSLCFWILALEHYHQVAKMVRPKQEKVEEAAEAVELANKRLKRKQDCLSLILEHLKRFQKDYDDKVGSVPYPYITGPRLLLSHIIPSFSFL